MNKKGKQGPLAGVIEGVFALFFAVVFFGIIMPTLNTTTGIGIPGFSIIIFLSFVMIILAIIASIVNAFGGRR